MTSLKRRKRERERGDHPGEWPGIVVGNAGILVLFDGCSAQRSRRRKIYQMHVPVVHTILYQYRAKRALLVS